METFYLVGNNYNKEMDIVQTTNSATMPSEVQVGLISKLEN